MTTHAILKPMTIKGMTVTVEQQTQAIEKLRSKKAFKLLDLTINLTHSGAPAVGDRASDRLLQNLRKQGLIAFSKEIPGYWTWVS